MSTRKDKDRKDRKRKSSSSSLRRRSDKKTRKTSHKKDGKKRKRSPSSSQSSPSRKRQSRNVEPLDPCPKAMPRVRPPVTPPAAATQTPAHHGKSFVDAANSSVTSLATSILPHGMQPRFVAARIDIIASVDDTDAAGASSSNAGKMALSNGELQRMRALPWR